MISHTFLVLIFMLYRHSYVSCTDRAADSPHCHASDTKNRLKIALLVEPTPFNYVSGYSNRFKEMLRHLHAAGDEVHVLTPDDSTNPIKQFLGFKVTPLSGYRLIFYSHVYLSIDIYGETDRVLKELQPDIVHVSSPGTLAFPAIYYAYKHNIPLVMSYHTHLPLYAKDYFPVPGVQKFAEFLIWTFHNMADLTLVTSPQLKSELESFGVKRVGVWQKGINTEIFAPRYRNESVRQELMSAASNAGGMEDGTVLLVYVGRLGKEKNLKRLKQVLQTVPGTRLVLAGTGPYESDLKNHFLGSPVWFTGELHGEELSTVIASCDIFTMPSETETLGFVVLEALASGLPVVGVAAGGLLDTVQHGKTGFLAAPGDESMTEFSAYVGQLATDEDMRRRFALNGREWSEQWSWGAATDKLRTKQYAAAIELHKFRESGIFRTHASGAEELVRRQFSF